MPFAPLVTILWKCPYWYYSNIRLSEAQVFIAVCYAMFSTSMLRKVKGKKCVQYQRGLTEVQNGQVYICSLTDTPKIGKL